MVLINWGALKKWVEKAVKIFKAGRQAGLWKEDHKPKF